MFLIFEELLYICLRIEHKQRIHVLKNEKIWLMSF